MLITVTDKDGGTSSPVSRLINVGAAKWQGSALVVGGTLGADTILIKPGSAAGTLTVTINGVSQGTFSVPDQLLVYAQAGADSIQLQTLKVRSKTTYITVPAILDGGTGNETIDARGSKADNVILGGDGADPPEVGGTAMVQNLANAPHEMVHPT